MNPLRWFNEADARANMARLLGRAPTDKEYAVALAAELRPLDLRYRPPEEPTMPMDRSRYPHDWDEISQRIRDQGGHRCEVCGKTAQDLTASGYRVVLTCHHIGIDRPDGTAGSPHDKMDCRDENLIVLCQIHHLLAEGEIRKQDQRGPLAPALYWTGAIFRSLERRAWDRVHRVAALESTTPTTLPAVHAVHTGG